MKTVLLTGATGFIGQFAISPLLAKKYVVHAVTSKPITQKSSENLFWHRADLLKPEETNALLEKIRPTHLLHFAWYVEHRKVWNAVENIQWLEASLHLARLFTEYGGQRLVSSGSCAEYDWTQSGIYSEETTSLRPHRLYGVAKHALNITLTKFAEVSKLSYAWGRIFYPFGIKSAPERLIAYVMNSLLRNRAADISHGQQIRDFMYVADIAEAFVALLESDVTGSVNISSGKPVKIVDVVRKIGEISGKPELLRIGTLAAPKDEPMEMVADITRLRDEVGWHKEFDMTQKLNETYDWWKLNYKKYD